MKTLRPLLVAVLGAASILHSSAFAAPSDAPLPSYVLPLASRIVRQNLTLAPPPGHYPEGRFSNYDSVTLGFHFLKELERADLPQERLYVALMTLIYSIEDFPARVVWVPSLRNLIQHGNFDSASREDLEEMLESVLNPIGSGARSLVPRNESASPNWVRTESPPRISESFAAAKRVIEKIPSIFSIRNSLVGALNTLENQLIGELDDDCYDTDPDCQFGSNEGMIHYYSRRVLEDHDLALATFRLHLRLVAEDTRAPHKGSFQYDDRATLSVWPIALKAANGDVDRALESIAVLGHDVCCNSLSAKSSEYAFVTGLLDSVSANANSADDDPISHFYVPEALPGTRLSKSTMKGMRTALANYNQAFGTDISLRAGYYHVYGGVANARALIAAGYGADSGLNIAVAMSQVLGHSYKRLQLPTYLAEDATEIWTRAEADPAKVAASVPAEWDTVRKTRALAELRLHLAILDYTEEQHRVGAQFAFRAYQRANSWRR